MRSKPYFQKIFLGFFIFLSAFFQGKTVHAYLDPGTGSMIIQLVVGAIAAALFTLKLYWGRIKKFFSRDPSKTEKISVSSD
jgi:quinol-cytochrome oxidoreductase complex cytochrome b subunit